MSDKLTVVKYAFEGEKFEILVKPDPALDYKLGKIKDVGTVLVSEEIYQNSGKGTRASSEKLQKAFNNILDLFFNTFERINIYTCITNSLLNS